jgi:hypothetical protein
MLIITYLEVRVIFAADVEEEAISLLDDPDSQQLILASCGKQPSAQTEFGAPDGPLMLTCKL